MGFTTKQEILEKFESLEHRGQVREIRQLQKDISTARGVIADGIKRYRKKKLGARSAAQANGEDPFAELRKWTSKEDIDDAYGWEIITEKEHDHLLDLWELRAEASKHAGIYEDRVTEMLEHAMNCVDEKYIDVLDAFEHSERRRERDAERIARENNDRAYARKHGDRG